MLFEKIEHISVARKDVLRTEINKCN